jgi:two-component system, NtrC family, sensor kinase
MNMPLRRILLVDDMPSIHEDFRRVLAPARDSVSLEEAESVLFGAAAPPRTTFDLDCASSGEEGLRLLRAAAMQGRPYSLAFVDMRMPAGWDGVRTIEELWREDGELQVVICTAYSDHPLEQALTRLGSPDRLLVLKKPFDPIEVSQLARALVAKR